MFQLSPKQAEQALILLDAARKYDALIAAYQQGGSPDEIHAAHIALHEADARKREVDWRLLENPLT